MRINKAAAIPLFTHDPYFSVWAPADKPYDADPIHWSGLSQKVRGYVTVDGATYCFLGDKEFHQVIEQKYVDVTATATEYCFENEKITMKVRFTSPLLLNDLTLVSRPCTYVDVEVDKKTECTVKVDFMLSSELVQRGIDPLIGGVNEKEATAETAAFTYTFMGRAQQHPLGNSGDNITIDWGYLYLAADQETAAALTYDKANRCIRGVLTFEKETETKKLIVAFDDLLSINYFGQWRKAYWTETYADILTAIGASFADREETYAKAAALDKDIFEKAEAIGGKEYAFLCNMSYRHSICAHKLITDENGEVMFLSKENDSNGCIGTVDVSYPSVPLYLLYNTEYVKGMLRPIFRFTDCDVWEYDFAPHDVGRYPYAWGQAYGLSKKNPKCSHSRRNGEILPPYYMYGKGSGIYDFHYQMPVEECGNMLVMTALVCMLDGNTAFAEPHMDVLKTWTNYLIEYGADPGEQLCTDDFAGHLSHNVNLSVKAIVGIEAYAWLLREMGQTEEADKFHKIAKDMAADWEVRAAAGDHYRLVFDNPDTWSLKYNLVWDKFFGSGLFSDEVYEKELAYYVKKTNVYGTPLDSRCDYTKSDWILWCVAMTKDREQIAALVNPIAKYLEETTSRYPFGDWYETVEGVICHFKGRSVQGGIFMPMLMAEKGK